MDESGNAIVNFPLLLENVGSSVKVAKLCKTKEKRTKVIVKALVNEFR